MTLALVVFHYRWVGCTAALVIILRIGMSTDNAEVQDADIRQISTLSGFG